MSKSDWPFVAYLLSCILKVSQEKCVFLLKVSVCLPTSRRESESEEGDRDHT